MKLKLILLVISLCSSVAFADFNSALDAYTSGDYKTAYDQFDELAKMGEKRSQYNLGVMYFYGQHVEKDINKSYAWLKLATQGEGIEQDKKDVFETVVKQVEDQEQAQAIYHELYAEYSSSALLKKLYPVIVSPTNAAAFEATPIKITEPRYPRKALMRGVGGIVKISFNLDKFGKARNVLVNTIIPSDYPAFGAAAIKSVRYWKFEPAKDNDGNPIASESMVYSMDFLLEGGTQFDENHELYIKTKALADNGDPEAQYKMGYWSKNLNLVKSDRNPNEWFLQSAVQGYSPAQYQLGKNLIYGKGCKIDKPKGIEWLARAASNEQPDAKELLAMVNSKISSHEAHLFAKEYFESVEDRSIKATLNYAWLLATSPYDDIADPKKARELVDDFPREFFFDPVTELEIEAASYARAGNFKKAIKLQEEAIEDAEDWKFDSTEAQQRLSIYQQKKTWF